MENMRKDTDISALLTRNGALEAHIVSLRNERDRLLEVSSNLKVQLHASDNRRQA